MNYHEIFNSIDREATDYAYKTEGENVMIFPCGFASIRFPRKDYIHDPFIKWMDEHGILGNDSYAKCYYIWVGEFNQSMNHKFAYAQKFVELIKEHVKNQTVYAWQQYD